MENIAVIGAGTMGNGIAHIFAMNGFKVNLVDISAERLEKALKTIDKNLWRMVAKEKIKETKKEETIENITTHTNISEAVKNSDLIIEAASENLDVKLKIFKALDEHAPENCILASNTSSISITKIASATKRPEKVIGMHFMNPVPVMKLVEVIRGYATDDATMTSIMETSKKLNKVPVEVNDYPGFVLSLIHI